jgi:hypothetical protein
VASTSGKAASLVAARVPGCKGSPWATYGVHGSGIRGARAVHAFSVQLRGVGLSPSMAGSVACNGKQMQRVIGSIW